MQTSPNLPQISVQAKPLLNSGLLPPQNILTQQAPQPLPPHTSTLNGMRPPSMGSSPPFGASGSQQQQQNLLTSCTQMQQQGALQRQVSSFPPLFIALGVPLHVLCHIYILLSSALSTSHTTWPVLLALHLSRLCVPFSAAKQTPFIMPCQPFTIIFSPLYILPLDFIPFH